MRATRCSVFTTPSRARHSLMSVREICETKRSNVALKESVAIALSTNFDLAIECLGAHVDTIVVKMTKRKFATSKFSNLGCVIPGLPQCFIEWSLRALSFFGI